MLPVTFVVKKLRSIVNKVKQEFCNLYQAWWCNPERHWTDKEVLLDSLSQIIVLRDKLPFWGNSSFKEHDPRQHLSLSQHLYLYLCPFFSFLSLSPFAPFSLF